MSDYIGSRKQVDEYIGSRLVVAGYQGSRKYFDAFDTVSGSPPLTFDSRVQQVLRNYAVYGSAGGAGSATSGSEPAGYKITLSLISGEWLQDYDLFIGSSKLGAEEHLDYKSGIIIKRTANLFDKSTVLRGYWINLDTGTLNPATNEYYVSDYITVRANTQYSFTYPNSSRTWFYDVNKNPVEIVPNVYGGTYTPMQDGYLRFTIYRHATLDIMMAVEGATLPASYLPYLQNTDPPVPFPAITVYKGNNTISSVELPSSISVTGRINV